MLHPRAIVFAAVLCLGAWAYSVPATSLGGKDSLPTPLQPDNTQMLKDLEALRQSYLTELSDEKAAVIERQSRYGNTRGMLTSSLVRTSGDMDTNLLFASLCRRALDRLNMSSNAISQALAGAADNRLTRDVQRATVKTRTAEYVQQALVQIDNVLEAKSRVEQEIASQSDARGDGVRFDKFVTNHTNAVEALHRLTDMALKVKGHLLDKINHTQAMQRKADTALSCPECDVSLQSLHEGQATLGLAQRDQLTVCEALTAGDVRIRGLVQELKRKLSQLDDEEAVQVKHEGERVQTTQQQLLGVKALMGQ